MFQDGSSRTISSTSSIPPTKMRGNARVSPSTSSTSSIHTPSGELPWNLGFPRRKTDGDTQDKQRWVRPITQHFPKFLIQEYMELLVCGYDQQSCQDWLVPFASLSTISGTVNSLFKVLFIFPSWYLYAIGLEPIFSFRWNLPPTLRSNPEERDS